MSGPEPDPRAFSVPRRADPNAEVDQGDELAAIQEEISHTLHPGYMRRTDWLQWTFQKQAQDLALGRILDERERHHAEGRCQMIQEIFNRDLFLGERVKELTIGEREENRGEEGGDLGLKYDMAGQ